ncbi:tail fiber assembly protein [Salmonella enterica]|nr:tail fiber assembly protein [Salmonella enterica]EGT8850120.1 tail fiber assembly protein [Salmonella enterica]ELC3092675.1 tail fiber assembly protein [Salmonella enterica]
MMHLKNISAGNPKTMAQFQLTKRSGVIWLYSEDGKNWYDEQKNFAADTLKIAYDQNGVIVNISKDVSTINPTGLSVVELPNITANRRADIYGGWVFDGEKVIKRVYTTEELSKKAEAEKVRRLAEAESAIAPLARAVKLKIATDEEIKRLDAWELYSVMVNRVDTASPDWPDVPVSQ